MKISDSDAYPILQDLLAQTSFTGEAFLREMTRAIATTFHADLVFVAQAQGEPACDARVRAAWRGGEPAAVWNYALADTPCRRLYLEHCARAGERRHDPVTAIDVSLICPDDRAGREASTALKPDSGNPATDAQAGTLAAFEPSGQTGSSTAQPAYSRYVGITLYGDDRNALGHIALYFIGLDHADPALLDFLRLLAGRAQAELSRVLLEEQREHMLTRLAELSTQLESESISDFLTGLYNRRYFTQRIKEAYARHQRSGENYALIVLDVDHFNHLNEVHGHDTGDSVLRQLGRILLDSTRMNVEVVFRLGDEEFAILCHGPIRSDGLRNLGNRINRAVRSHAFGSPAQDIDVTVSLGAALPRAEDSTWDSIHRRADAAMHMAKLQGRDRTVIDG